MYLKRLEIQGFKSLADKIDLQFNPGISVIVGPNGCGKSNIADAIRWVLGEQSAKSLRGAKMEDVIFAGSDKRKQVGMAEVSITLDNSASIFPIDFSEVTVTRRVYRSGESEYLINKSSCRLKDVHELFMDTGIGREGYSIIGQGKIDEILSVKSEDRRAIIEEAAGIVKYKSRKQQAVRKLEDTEQNLLRINDIIHELETQVGPLEEQSQKAQEYLGYKEELGQLEVNLIINQVMEQKEKLGEITDREEQLKHSLIESETAARGTESVYEEKKLALTKLDEEIAVSQKNVYEIGSGIEKKESGILVAAERLKGIESQKQNLLAEISELRIKEAREREKFTGDEGNLSKVKARIFSEQEKLELLEKELQNTDLKFQGDQKMIEDSKADIIDLLNEIAGVRNSISTGEANLRTLVKRIDQLEEQKTNSKDEYNSIQQKSQELQNTRDATLREINRLTSEDKTLAQKNETMKREISGLRVESEQLRGTLQEKTSRLKALEELRDSYEGYYRGVKEVLKESKSGKECPGVCGVVAELLKVPEKYETALEVALGGSLQFIVTETDEDARQAIEYLKRKRGGRATFLPLSTIKPNIKEKPGFKNGKNQGLVGAASEVVNFDPKYKPIVEYLLGRVMIAENIKHATELARYAVNVSRIVTLDGDVVNPGGAMTGGSYQKGSTGLLSRERDIEQTGETIKQLQQKSKEIESRLDSKREDLEKVFSRINEIRSIIQELRMKESSEEKDLQILLQEKDRIDSSRKIAEMEVQSLTEELRNTESGINRNKELMSQLQSKDQQTRKSIEKHSNELIELEEERIKLKERVTESKVCLAALRQDELNLTEIADRVMNSIREIEENIKKKDQQIIDFDELNRSLMNETALLEDEIKALNQQKGLQQEILEKLRNDKQAVGLEIEQLEGIIRNTSKEINQNREQLHSLQVKRTRLEFEIESSINKLLDEFEQTYEEAFLNKTEITNKKEVTTRIRQLREVISSLGNVNVGAIEEYTRVKERYDFLTGQFEDLTRAKESLFGVIEEMEQIMTKKFSRAFAEINENFGIVFTKLFGGGKAELVLTDKENLLESGIEILAQPPGKKNQHLSLLSGGEKALTAIALLFAILQTKPSPFCVLDEIEAALDEANVDRFAEYLKEFALNTQFIVITHRKGTMEAADVLFGVTMDDAKVTKMVSMKLSDIESKVS